MSDLEILNAVKFLKEGNSLLVQRVNLVDDFVADFVFTFVLVFASTRYLVVQRPHVLVGFVDEALGFVLCVNEVGLDQHVINLVVHFNRVTMSLVLGVDLVQKLDLVDVVLDFKSWLFDLINSLS